MSVRQAFPNSLDPLSLLMPTIGAGLLYMSPGNQLSSVFMHTRKAALLVTCVLWMLASDCYAAAAARPQTRCGWFDNPTPGNASLHDRDGEWTIAIQGTYEAAGDWPRFRDSQWVPVNGSHGYGCACIKAVVNAKAVRS